MTTAGRSIWGLLLLGLLVLLPGCGATVRLAVLGIGQNQVATELTPLAELRAGDRFRLRVTLQRPGYVYVLEGAQPETARLLTPITAVPRSPAGEVKIPSDRFLVLGVPDKPVETERIFVVVADRPQSEPVLRTLCRGALNHAGRSGATKEDGDADTNGGKKPASPPNSGKEPASPPNGGKEPASPPNGGKEPAPPSGDIVKKPDDHEAGSGLATTRGPVRLAVRQRPGQPAVLFFEFKVRR